MFRLSYPVDIFEILKYIITKQYVNAIQKQIQISTVTQENNASTERETILLEFYAWKHMSNMIYDSSELSLDISNLGTKYNELTKSYRIPYSTSITSFLKKLKHQFPGLMSQNFLKAGKKLHDEHEQG